MDVEHYRAETPGCQNRIHLNNAGAALMPKTVISTIIDHIKLESEIGGYEAHAAVGDAVASTYQSVASLIGAGVDNIAFTENATSAFTQALSAIPFSAGDVILTTRNDYASNQIQFLSMETRLGVRVVHAPDQEQGGVDVATLEKMMDEYRPKLVCVTHVPTNSGLLQDVNAVGAACRSRDTIFLVDACQSLGQLPLAVDDIQCDFLSATARKFLRGPRGSGFLYVADRILEQAYEPLFIDMRGASWTAADRYQSVTSAKRFENWEFSWAQLLGTGAAARYASEVGVDRIRCRVRELVSYLRDGLRMVKGARVLGSDDELCGIVTIEFNKLDPQQFVLELREQGINLSAQGREYAVLDYDNKKVSAALRISPHYYNTKAEIDTAIAAIDGA